MSDTPQLLPAHHLKALKLPTFLREYDKLAQQCAAEGVDHPRYLLRLAELELIERERRMIERRIKEARFPTVKSLDSFDFTAIPSLNKTLVLDNSLSFTPTSYGWVSGILWTIAVIVFVVGYVGLINCARFRSFRGWSAIAVGVTTLSLIGAILKTIAEFSGNPVNEVQQLYDVASAINVQVPKKVDAITTLTKAEYRDDVFTYYYDIDRVAYQSPNWSMDKAKVIIKANACETFKGSVGTAALRSVRYAYKADGKDVFVIEVGGRDCEPAH